jgi:hypothetical protein
MAGAQAKRFDVRLSTRRIAFQSRVVVALGQLDVCSSGRRELAKWAFAFNVDGKPIKVRTLTP